MFRKLLIVSLFAVFTLSFARDSSDLQVAVRKSHALFSPSWSPFQLSLFTRYSLFDYMKTDIFGFNLGLTASNQNKVFGVSVAPIATGTITNYGIMTAGLFTLSSQNHGIAISLFNMIEENDGIMIGLINGGVPCRRERTIGWNVQIGILNEAGSGLQIGLLNHNPNALVPWMPLFNFSRHKKRTASTEKEVK